MTDQMQMLREIKSKISQVKLLIESDKARLAINPASKAIQRSIMSWTYELNDLESKFRSLKSKLNRMPVTIELEQLDNRSMDSEWDSIADLINKFSIECALEPKYKVPSKGLKKEKYEDIFCIESKERYRSTIRARKSNLFIEESISAIIKLIPYILQSQDERSFLGACVSLGVSPAKRLGELVALLSALNVMATLSWESKDKYITTFIKHPRDKVDYFSNLNNYLVSDDIISGIIESSDMATTNIRDKNTNRYMIFCRNLIDQKAVHNTITSGTPLALKRYTFNNSTKQHTIYATNCEKLNRDSKV